MQAGNILREKASQVKLASRDKIATMHGIDMTSDELVSALLNIAASETVCILDSCGVGHLGSHLLIAGIEPVEAIEIRNDDPDETLRILDDKLSGEFAVIFTISYDFGLNLLGIDPRKKSFSTHQEPDVYIALFNCLIIHDYDGGTTRLSGNSNKFESIWQKLKANVRSRGHDFPTLPSSVTSNFTKPEYLAAIESIKERIRCGDTYQTNLTQQLRAELPREVTPKIIFERLRRDHPAPFSAFIKRLDSTVVSASPERFFHVDEQSRTITTSPIKGTRPRGDTTEEDDALREELLASSKDRAENTMIVDLLRNDLGRVCEYGSVRVDKLCDLEEHPTLFHLVSSVSGDLRPNTKLSDILKAVFPCGSITGAPKISTMKIIDETETKDRGLSMGAIGYYFPKKGFGPPATLDLSVAIRTMVIRDDIATFNVGGGIVIDSDPESEYNETLLKAKALLAAVNGRLI